MILIKFQNFKIPGQIPYFHGFQNLSQRTKSQQSHHDLSKILHIRIFCSPLCLFFKCFHKFPPSLGDTKSHWLHLFRLFSTVYFEIGLQSVCKRGSKLTLTALVWLFSTVCCQMCSQMACLRGCIVTLVAFVFLSPLCIFKCVVKALAQSDVESNWLRLFDFSPLCILNGFRKSHAQEDA